MARKRSQNTVIISSVLSFVIGFVLSAFIMVYISIPDSYIIPDTQTSHGTVLAGNLNVEKITSQELSIHFLELGNKYTGDCTLIKVGNTEILVDAGSRANSVTTIQSYLNQYVTDGIIEYVIVTHAHQDHYAGFATAEGTESLFDLYDVGTVIQFAQVTANTAKSKIYANYQRELTELQDRYKDTEKETKVFTALECVKQLNGADFIYDLGNGVQMEILDQEYYHKIASTENDHSVCMRIVQNDKYYLFTGDLEKSGEESLVDRNKPVNPELEKSFDRSSEYQLQLQTDERYQLYKAGHHGSKTSSNEVLLSAIRPLNVCVCCCAGSSEYTTNNANQFPTQDFINRVAPYTTQIFVTTLCIDYKAGTFTSMNGNIVVYCNRTDAAVTINCAHNGTILKDTEWFKTNRTMPNTWKV